MKTKVSKILKEQDGEIIDLFFSSEQNEEYHKYNTEEQNQCIAAFQAADITFSNVASHGGEGEGEDYWSVYKFMDNTTKETVYVKFDGWYQSYNGSEFDEWYFVVPKEVLVTVYNKE